MVITKRKIMLEAGPKLEDRSQAGCTFFAFNKLCYAYLNNDWILVLSSFFTTTFLVAILIITVMHKVISWTSAYLFDLLSSVVSTVDFIPSKTDFNQKLNIDFSLMRSK